MVLQYMFKTGYLAILALFAATLCVQGSEDDDWQHCPTKREWASTIDPENRAFFQMFSEAAIGAHGPDGYASQGMVAVDLLYSLMTHAYQDTPGRLLRNDPDHHAQRDTPRHLARGINALNAVSE